MDKDERKGTTAGWRVNKTSQFLIKDVPKAEQFSALGPEAVAAAEKLWRSMIGLRTTTKPERQPQKDGWQLKRIKDVLLVLFPPDGRVPSNLTLKAIQARLLPAFEKKGWKVPSTDSIARACDRRERD